MTSRPHRPSRRPCGRPAPTRSAVSDQTRHGPAAEAGTQLGSPPSEARREPRDRRSVVRFGTFGPAACPGRVLSVAFTQPQQAPAQPSPGGGPGPIPVIRPVCTRTRSRPRLVTGPVAWRPTKPRRPSERSWRGFVAAGDVRLCRPNPTMPSVSARASPPPRRDPAGRPTWRRGLSEFRRCRRPSPRPRPFLSGRGPHDGRWPTGLGACGSPRTPRITAPSGHLPTMGRASAFGAPISPPRDLRVALNRWWTAPGSVAHALEFLKAHPPSGAEVDGTGTRTQPGQLSVYSILYGHPTQALPMLEIDVTAYRDGVAVHANVQDSGSSS